MRNSMGGGWGVWVLGGVCAGGGDGGGGGGGGSKQYILKTLPVWIFSGIANFIIAHRLCSYEVIGFKKYLMASSQLLSYISWTRLGGEVLKLLKNEAGRDCFSHKNRGVGKIREVVFKKGRHCIAYFHCLLPNLTSQPLFSCFVVFDCLVCVYNLMICNLCFTVRQRTWGSHLIFQLFLNSL